ncbi:MAG: TetR/AcrR family transcriptional regulator [Alphaproteobacteria bacterium]|nr:TetR/AcrR family transcriptional regulator [Alphaproteobacteria bacterium]
MPYSRQHKRETRARIIESAHRLFNRRGFAAVSIDDIMAEAGLTRGGFYNHFKAKEDLYAEMLVAYAVRRSRDNDDLPQCGPDMARAMINKYVSKPHLEDVDGHCPLMALPSDVSRAGTAARAAYRDVLESMISLFEPGLEPKDGLSARQQGIALAATCVGAMVLARTVDDPDLANEICTASAAFACNAIGSDKTAQGSRQAATGPTR